MTGMTSITVRNVPDRVKASLAQRAKSSGESLEAFLRRLLEREASQPDPTDDMKDRLTAILARADRMPPLAPGQKDAWQLSEELSLSDAPAMP